MSKTPSRGVGKLLEPEEHAARAWEFYRKTLGGPRYVSAPMVDQSELPYRLMMRRTGCNLCYTPMFHAEEIAGLSPSNLSSSGFLTCPEDRPLITQFCANVPEQFLEAAIAVQDHCDAVDLNLGCPQQKALKAGWGGALMDEENWHIVYAIVKKAATSPDLRVPVTCKIRVFADMRKTIRFARMIEEAGCSMLTVHGRQRCRTLQHAPADWSAIKAVREALRIPVIANGGVSSCESAERCLSKTGCVGAMVATALLADPELFANAPPTSADPTTDVTDKSGYSKVCEEESDDGVSTTATSCVESSSSQRQPEYVRAVRQCLAYLEICQSYPPFTTRAPRDHLRAILSPFQKQHPDVFEAINVLASTAVAPTSFADPCMQEPLDSWQWKEWHEYCQRFRDILRILSLRIGLAGENDARFEGHSWGAQVLTSIADLVGESFRGSNEGKTAFSGGAVAQALARQVPVSKRYQASEQRRAAALKAAMMAAGSRHTVSNKASVKAS